MSAEEQGGPVFRLDGLVAVVTGAGSAPGQWGVGKTIAAVLSDAGASVCLLDVNETAVEETRRVIEERNGKAIHVVADVTSSADIDRAVDACLKSFGRIDILVNNVAHGAIGGPLDVSEAEWDRILAVNLKSMFLCTKAVLPTMLAAGSGRIINISSIAALGYTGNPLLAYSVSKAGGHQLTREVALQFGGSGIRANTVVVGMLDTPIIRRHVEEIAGKDAVEPYMRQRDAQIPVGKQGSAFDVAYAVRYLASVEAGFVNGTELIIDGGSTARAN